MPDAELDRLGAAGVGTEPLAVGMGNLGGGGDLLLAHDGGMGAGVRHEGIAGDHQLDDVHAFAD